MDFLGTATRRHHAPDSESRLPNDQASARAQEVGRADAVVVNLPDVALDKKLAVLGAAIQAVREAHRDVISSRSWCALNRAEGCIAEAMVYLNDGRLIEG